MMRSIYLKTLYERRWFTLGWFIGLLVLTALMVVFYPAMHQDQALDALVKNMPPAFEGLVGDLTNLNQFSTYIASQLFDIRLPLIAGIMAIILGLGLSTAEEDSGELRTLLALPISRTKVLFEKWLAMATILFVLCGAFAVGIYGVGMFVEGADLSLELFGKLTAMTWLLMVTFGTITLGAGLMFGKKSLAMAVGVGVIMGSFILSTFGAAVDWLEPYEKLSIIHYFPAIEIVKNTADMTGVFVLGGVTVAVLATAWLLFRRRDIA